MRVRTIRIGAYEIVGSERIQSESVEAILIPRLERELGANHRSVHAARQRAQKLRDAELEKLARAMRSLSYFRGDPEE